MKLSKTTFQMAVRNLDRSIGKQETPGYLFTVEEINFIVHRPLNDTVGWTVSEETTGMRISSNYKTRQDAIDYTVNTVNQLGKEKVFSRIELMKEQVFK